MLSWANVIYQRRGVIGLNILKRECKNRDVSFDNVKNILEKEGVAFVNYDGW